MADAREEIFWRVDKSEDYGMFNDLARSYMNTNRFELRWDGMLRVADL
ncbi:MAG: hypothetical protein H0U49_03745 [Parachlamydiaceae bacterium]|nr:hypothetical protein [Parachlamydiaceae bacterium]